MGTGAGVRVTASARTDGRLDLSRKATIRINIFTTYHDVTAGAAACYGGSKVNLGPILHCS
jgi:hypothetical protein